MRRNRVTAERVDLKAGIVGMTYPDLQGLAVRSVPKAYVAECACCSPRRGRRCRATTAGVYPDAAHLQSAVGGLGDGAHRCPAIDAHAHTDFRDARPSGEIKGRGDR